MIKWYCIKTSGSLFRYYRDEPTLDNDSANVDFINDSTTDSFKFKEKITDNTQRWYKGCWNNGTTKIFEWILEHFWRTLEKSLILSEKNLHLN